jgi:hypothetical protein
VCPACLTSLAITVASTTGAGAAVTALVVRVTRSLTKATQSDTPTREDHHESVDARRGDRPRVPTAG